MGREIAKSVMRKIMRSVSCWMVTDGRATLLRLLRVGNLERLEAVQSVVRTVVGRMMQVANPILAASGQEPTASTQTILESTCNLLLGTIEQNVAKYHLDRQRASEIARAWTELQAVKARFDKRGRNCRRAVAIDRIAEAGAGRPFVLLRGDQVDVGEEIARGAYGSVCKLRRIDSQFFPMHKQYVGKMLREDKFARRKLANEATNVGVSHAAFVTTLGMTLSAPCMIIMEYWPHGHLGKYLWRWRVSADKADPFCDPPDATRRLKEQLGIFEKCFTNIMLQLADALSFLHAHKTSHNDLHEGNVLLELQEKDGVASARVGICDWGRACTESEPRPITAAFKEGARNYIAPEHLVERSKEHGAVGAPSTDVFAFGYLLKCVSVKREDRMPPRWLELAGECQSYNAGKRPSMDRVAVEMREALQA